MTYFLLGSSVTYHLFFVRRRISTDLHRDPLATQDYWTWRWTVQRLQLLFCKTSLYKILNHIKSFWLTIMVWNLKVSDNCFDHLLTKFRSLHCYYHIKLELTSLVYWIFIVNISLETFFYFFFFSLSFIIGLESKLTEEQLLWGRQHCSPTRAAAVIFRSIPWTCLGHFNLQSQIIFINFILFIVKHFIRPVVYHEALLPDFIYF